MTIDRSWMLNPDRHCKGSNLFFPEDTVGVIKARAICFPPGGNPCPVWEQCREYALTNHEIYGAWAGMSMRERQRRRINHGTEGGYQHHQADHSLPCGDCCWAHNQLVRQQIKDEQKATA
jgi:hypothetical protein